MRGRLDHLRREREHGQILVLFALFLTVLLTLGSIVLDVGNWFVLHRHLQTQVDAAALAGGPGFTACSQNPSLATATVTQQALEFAGDPSRDASTENLLMEDTADAHVVLNSSAYWSQGVPTPDWTLGTPCATKFLEVKATEDEAPLLWGWIPFFPDLKTRARVEISKVPITDGLRPLGVPEINPEQVAVLFVDEDGNPNSANSVRGTGFLDPQPTPPAGLEAMSVWKANVDDVGINGSDNFGVIIVASRSPNPISLNGTLSQICGQEQTRCYGGDSLDSGISFIHAYSTSGSGSAGGALIRGVTLSGGCPDDLSRPYFNLEGGCAIGINAVVDFGPDFGPGGVDPSRPAAQGGVCAEVSASPGGSLTWVNGVWTGAALTPAVESGGNQVNLSWSTDPDGACGGRARGGGSGNFPKVAKPYASDNASGPVQYLTVERPGSGIANSMSKDSDASLDVTVGFVAPLRDRPWTGPPLQLRFWNLSSQSQGLDCEVSGASPQQGWNLAMANGCKAYQVYDEAKHVDVCGDPPNGVPAADPPDCIDSQNGNFQQNTVEAMFTPCADHPNRWDGMNLPPPDDKRWMPLFILDELAYAEPGRRTYPIRRFGMFYVTAISEMNCPGDDPNPVPSTQQKREMYGHFVSYVTPGFGETIPSTEPCSFTDGGLCVSNLVE